MPKPPCVLWVPSGSPGSYERVRARVGIYRMVRALGAGAAVNQVHDAGHERRPLAGEESSHSGELVRAADAADRVLLPDRAQRGLDLAGPAQDRKSTRLNSSHPSTSYAVFCLKKKKNKKYLFLIQKKKKLKDTI